MLIAFPSPVALPGPASALAVAGTQPATPEGALAALDQVVAGLAAAHDARAVFPNVYAVITEKVIERLSDGSGYFRAPEFITMLVGVFTTRYLQTLNWSLRGLAQDSAGWDLAYRLAAADALPALGHAALGISAHINFDLALGIHEVVVRLGATGDQSRLEEFKHDHDAVNALLAASVPESLLRLREAHGCALVSSLPDSALERLAPYFLKVLAGWRDDVWRNMLELLGATCEAERARVLRRMDDRAAAAGAAIVWQGAAGARLAGLFRHGTRRWPGAADSGQALRRLAA